MSEKSNRPSDASIEKQLAIYSSNLAGDYRRVAGEVSGQLREEEFLEWLEAGMALAGQSWRSWEAASEYFRASPRVLPLLGYAALREWTQYGRELTELSSALASSYFRSSPETLQPLSAGGLAQWVSLGRQLYKGTWRSASLAMQFFDTSPTIFARLTLEEASILVRFVDSLCDRSYDLASYCLSVAPEALSSLPGEDRKAFLAFAEIMATTSWADARSYLEKGPGLLSHIHSEQRVRFLELAAEVARRDNRQSYTHFAEAARSLAKIDLEYHAHLLSLAEDLVPLSAVAAMDFLKTVPEALERIRIEDLEGYFEEGLQLLATSSERGEAYFRLETNRAFEVLESLSHRVELHRVRDILSLYSKALTGADVAIHSTDVLTEKGIGWVNVEAPSTEGTGVFLPLKVEEFLDKASNFAVYKVLVTHQAGHLEFDSFGFRFAQPSTLFEDLRPHLPGVKAPAEEGGNGHEPLTDMERFFDLFENRRLAADLFQIAEDTRIDAFIEREYQGIRKAYRETQRRELEKRPPIERLPLQQAFMENLVRASLGGFANLRWHPGLLDVLPYLNQALTIVKILREPGALVEDAAEATIRLYRLLEKIPNLALDLPEDEWYDLSEDQLAEAGEGRGEGQPELGLEGEEVAYQSPQPVESRGEF
ncbi:MAG TPA: hypothetical protein VNL15_01840, partial [Dehalococcoidia bacterium]|nr:hypothetical protein [Dehalococcoidia bacterium]